MSGACEDRATLCPWGSAGIIVGVYNTEDRFAEYTQARDTGEYAHLGGGNADAYGRFLVEELKPVIDKTFRTRTDARNTALVGSSLGAW